MTEYESWYGTPSTWDPRMTEFTKLPTADPLYNEYPMPQQLSADHPMIDIRGVLESAVETVLFSVWCGQFEERDPVQRFSSKDVKHRIEGMFQTYMEQSHLELPAGWRLAVEWPFIEMVNYRAPSRVWYDPRTWNHWHVRMFCRLVVKAALRAPRRRPTDPDYYPDVTVEIVRNLT